MKQSVVTLLENWVTDITGQTSYRQMDHRLIVQLIVAIYAIRKPQKTTVKIGIVLWLLITSIVRILPKLL